MTQLMIKNMKFQWIDRYEQSFKELKYKLTSTPVLNILKGLEGFIIYSDANKQSLGYVLM